MPPEVRVVNVVPHTHWDREWYGSFQRFRLELVDLLDELIPRLETGDAGPHFMLDGQVAAVDDYLELRPEMEPRLTALVTNGRLAIGPWYVLPDEFLVSGETLVRNLQLGLRRGAELGGSMPVGYLPDMFGHIAQMPQLLRLAGFDNAVVWRGVPSSVHRTGFEWRSPDGSTVVAEYLPEGYGNGAHLPRDASALLATVRRFVETHEALLDGAVLWMNGTDHERPAPHLVAVVQQANAARSGFDFRIVSLADHLAQQASERRRGQLHTHHGEMRSGARANLLMGVTSNRVDIRQAAATTEVSLERLVEPLYSLFVPEHPWPDRELDLAWRFMIHNAAHDSVCACSSDEVVRTVANRYADARQIAQVLVERALYWFGCSLEPAGTAVCNTTSHPRRAVVEVTNDSRQPDLTSVEVPAFGWAVVSEARKPDPGDAVVVSADGLCLRNGHLRVDIDPHTGTFSIDGHAGMGRLVDGTDVGDTYNWCPPDDNSAIGSREIAEPTSVTVSVIGADPVRAVIAVDRAYELPVHAGDGDPAELRAGTIRMRIELRTGEPFVRLALELDNVWRDHRLRLILPLPTPAERSEAECAFAVVERGLAAEGGPTEQALATYPARRFVRAGGLNVAHDAVTEYELVDIDPSHGHAGAIALTVLRATAMLSRGPMATRPEPAGPLVALDDSQVLGPLSRRFAVQLGDVDPFALADAFTPMPAVRAPGGGARAATGSALTIHGAEVSSLTRDGDQLVVRVCNPRATASTLVIAGGRGAVVDLRGVATGRFDGEMELRPFEIATISLSTWSETLGSSSVA